MNYQYVKERGRGGFGVVAEVLGDDGNLYACKSLIVPPNLTEAEVRPRFEREVRYQSAIYHPNVVRILTSELSANPPWFIMPLAQCSLHDELMLDRTLNGDPTTALFQILAGLEEKEAKARRWILTISQRSLFKLWSERNAPISLLKIRT